MSLITRSLVYFIILLEILSVPQLFFDFNVLMASEIPFSSIGFYGLLALVF